MLMPCHFHGYYYIHIHMMITIQVGRVYIYRGVLVVGSETKGESRTEPIEQEKRIRQHIWLLRERHIAARFRRRHAISCRVRAPLKLRATRARSSEKRVVTPAGTNREPRSNETGAPRVRAQRPPAASRCVVYETERDIHRGQSPRRHAFRRACVRQAARRAVGTLRQAFRYAP